MTQTLGPRQKEGYIMAREPRHGVTCAMAYDPFEWTRTLFLRTPC
jgi:hypothetical protein